MNTKNKVTVIRKTPINGNPAFEVRNNGIIEAVFSFRINVPENDIYNEESNRQLAMALAAKIENGNTDTEEIIYQTPTN